MQGWRHVREQQCCLPGKWGASGAKARQRAEAICGQVVLRRTDSGVNFKNPKEILPTDEKLRHWDCMPGCLALLWAALEQTHQREHGENDD